MAPATAPEITRLRNLSIPMIPLAAGGETPPAADRNLELHFLVALERHLDLVRGAVALDERAAAGPVLVCLRELGHARHVLVLVLELVRDLQELRRREVLARL